MGLALVFVFSILSSCNSNPNNQTSQTAAHSDTIRLDYAYYNPVSLVLKEKRLAGGRPEEKSGQSRVGAESGQ